MKVLSMYSTIKTGTLSGPMRSWASWNDRVPLASPPKIRSPSNHILPQIESADALPTADLKAVPLEPSSEVSDKTKSRFARRPHPIYPKSKCLPPL